MTTIYFDDVKHKYTNEAGNQYTSVTTLIGKYEHKFDDNKYEIARACEKAGRNPNHRNYDKYKGKTASQLINEWRIAGKVGAEFGNKRHNYLEDSIKSSNNFYSIFETKYTLVNGKCTLYTIEDVLANNNFGEVNLDYFIKTNIQAIYPKIFNIISAFVNSGWKVYSEVGVFNNDYLISGLIDVLLVKGSTFVILDWKTNKDPIVFEGGYWNHDKHGKRTNYKYTDKCFKSPLHRLEQSTGNKYALQLSLYSFLTEIFGIDLTSIILCHINHDVYQIGHKDLETNPDWLGLPIVDIHIMPYLKNDVSSMVHDYHIKRSKGQYNIFNSN